MMNTFPYRKKNNRFLRFIRNLLFGDKRWGWFRLILTVSLLISFAILASVIFDKSLFPRLRYGVVPLFAFICAFMVGASYIQNLHQLERYRTAARYLWASLFGIGYPRLVISDAVAQLQLDKENILHKIGGPGYIIIRPGNVVLLETLEHPATIWAAGKHFISRFETIKEIISLEDQHSRIEELTAVTKDGIKLRVRDVEFRYKLWADMQERTHINPYPYSEEAVRNFAYSRAAKKGEIPLWPATVVGIIKSTISEYINQNQADLITAPRYLEGDPRDEIEKFFKSDKVKKRFRSIGTELLWLDIGHFDFVDEMIDKERLKTWQAKWTGSASVIRAYGEAQRLAYQELGRAEAQAEMLMSIVSALRDVEFSSEKRENLRNIVLARTAQILEAMTSYQRSDTNTSSRASDSQ
jgi:hypothetical protein